MMTTVIHGTPLAETLFITCGAWPACDIPNIMRPAPKTSLLMADRAAVMTTMLRIDAAVPNPRFSKIWTNGLLSELMVCHGMIAMMTARVQM